MVVKGITHVITHVYYVLELDNNLLSIGQLQEKGLIITIQNNKCNVVHPKRALIMEVHMSTNKIFVLSAYIASATTTCLQGDMEQDSQLWHNWLGHLLLVNAKIAYGKHQRSYNWFMLTYVGLFSHHLVVTRGMP